MQKKNTKPSNEENKVLSDLAAALEESSPNAKIATWLKDSIDLEEELHQLGRDKIAHGTQRLVLSSGMTGAFVGMLVMYISLVVLSDLNTAHWFTLAAFLALWVMLGLSRILQEAKLEQRAEDLKRKYEELHK